MYFDAELSKKKKNKKRKIKLNNPVCFCSVIGVSENAGLELLPWGAGLCLVSRNVHMSL